MSARRGAYSGEGLVSPIREQVSLRIATFAVVCLVVANLGLVVSEFAGFGAAFEIFGASGYIAVPIAAVIIGPGRVRHVPLRGAGVLAALAGVPRLPGRGVPRPPRLGSGGDQHHLAALRGQPTPFWVLAVALVGTTITPYIQLYQAAAVTGRGIGPEDYPRERLDRVGGAIFANVISMFIIIIARWLHL